MFDSIKIKSIYRTKNDDFDEDFLIPLLKNCKTYYRGTGYFNIQALINISKGLIPFIKNGGSMKLITSVELAFDEINLLNVSSEVAMNTITAELEKIIEKQLNDESDILTMDLITNLIAANRIEVKIAYLPNGGLYHEKIGYLEDFEENKVCFIGSNNETHSGQKRNAETISIIKSWDGGEEDTIGEKQYFENLWKNKEKEIEVVNFPTAAKNKLFSIYRKSSSYEESIKRIEEYYERLIIDSGKKELYKYQERAIDEFCNNKYCHFYEMATGTGKTFTAVKSVERMSNDMNGKSLYVIVVVPQIDLQEQWKNAFKEIDTKTYLFGGNSTNKDWELELSKSIIDYYNGEKIIVSICIYDTFFSKISKNLEGQKRINKLLIIDEAHELSKNQINMLSENYKFRLGLSATPERHKESETAQIINYFTRGNVETYKYTIDEAINNGFLSRYEYHPIKVYLEEDEFEKYKKYTLQLAQLLISWNGNQPKYDLRKWSVDGDVPYKGVTLTKSELMKIYEILSGSIKIDKNKNIKYKVALDRASGKFDACIYDVLGEYKESKSMPGKVTYMSWGGLSKYDIRQWNNDYSKCGKGLSLTEQECESLISAIKDELKLNGNSEFDTSEIDDLLL